jgi:hypothetical protein
MVEGFILKSVPGYVEGERDQAHFICEVNEEVVTISYAGNGVHLNAGQVEQLIQWLNAARSELRGS